MTEIPRRIRIDQQTPIEAAIRAAAAAVEAGPAHPHMTRATTLLGQALDAVADFVDGVPQAGTTMESVGANVSVAPGSTPVKAPLAEQRVCLVGPYPDNESQLERPNSDLFSAIEDAVTPACVRAVPKTCPSGQLAYNIAKAVIGLVERAVGNAVIGATTKFDAEVHIPPNIQRKVGNPEAGPDATRALMVAVSNRAEAEDGMLHAAMEASRCYARWEAAIQGEGVGSVVNTRIAYDAALKQQHGQYEAVKRADHAVEDATDAARRGEGS